MDNQAQGKSFGMGVFGLISGQDIEKLFFIVIGNFITSSYAKDFTLFDLLRKPINFPIVRKGNMFVTKIPKGFPWQETVLLLGTDFVTKIKDVPVGKGIQKGDENGDYLVINGSELDKKVFGWGVSQVSTGTLTYSPFYRFFTEPFLFNMAENVSMYLSNAIAYKLRGEGVENRVVSQDSERFRVFIDNSKLPFTMLEIAGVQSFDWLEVSSSAHSSKLDLPGRKISIAMRHSPLCFNALLKTEINALRNIKLIKGDERIELIYEQ